MATKSAICECQVKDIMNEDFINNELLGDSAKEITEIMSKSNIEVIKCLIKAFKYIKRTKCPFIVLALTICSIVFTTLFYLFQFSKIKLYIFSLAKYFFSYFAFENIPLMIPPRKIKKEEENDVKESYKNEEKKSIKRINKKSGSKHNVGYSRKNTNKKNKKLELESKKTEKNNIRNDVNEFQEFDNFKKREQTNINKEINNNYEEYFNIYLSKSIEDMDYDDAIKYDKRSFFEAFYDLISDKIMTINTFCVSDPKKPIMLGIVAYLLYINLYFFVNGLFFSEDYISKVYHLEKEDKFLLLFLGQ